MPASGRCESGPRLAFAGVDPGVNRRDGLSPPEPLRRGGWSPRPSLEGREGRVWDNAPTRSRRTLAEGLGAGAAVAVARSAGHGCRRRPCRLTGGDLPII